jgi:hypothetical protein
MLGKFLGYTTRIINPERLIQKVAGKEKIFGSSPFDARTQNILSGSKVPVGIFVDKNTGTFNQVIVPLYSEKDGILVEYIQRLIKNSGAEITVCDSAGIIKNQLEIKEAIRAIEHETPNRIKKSDKVIDEQFIGQFQLMMVTTDGWKKLVDSRQTWLKQTPSILILQT